MRLLFIFFALLLSKSVFAEPVTPETGLIQQNHAPIVNPAWPVNANKFDVYGNENAQAINGNDEAQILIQRFNIEGNRNLMTEEINSVLEQFTNRLISFKELQSALSKVKAQYEKKGYFLTRVFLPPQSISNQEITIQVIEPRYGNVVTEGSARLDKEVISEILTHHQVQPERDIFSQDLERALLLLSLQPATETYVKLQAGQTTGTSDLFVTANASKLVSGELGFDNYANRYNGEYRTSGLLRLNSPTGRGDDLTLKAFHANDHDFIYASYQMPIGYDGFKLGANFSRLDYKICCEFAVLDYQGSANTASLFASYPLVLSKASMLYVGTALSHKSMRDEALGTELNNRDNNAVQFSMAGVQSSQVVTRYNLILTAGNIDLSANSINQAGDALSAKTAGSYQKLRGMLRQRRTLIGKLWLDGQLTGQWASQNLDLSEKFYLGGVDGVRAYPQGEAVGDEGLLARLEIGRPVIVDQTGVIEIKGFFDAGISQPQKYTWVGSTNRQVDLYGIGIGVNWALPKGVVADLMVASKIGSNSGASASGSDADGRNQHARAWLSIKYDF